MYRVIALLMLVVSGPSMAAEGDAGNWRIGVTLASKHFISPPPALGGFNEDNLGVEAEYQITDTVYIGAGRYDNSIGSRSNFLGIGREMASGSLWGIPVSGGIESGVADGYEGFVGTDGKRWSKGGDYLLMGGPYARIGGQHALKLRYMFALVAASYQYEF